jgi:hypothetical protein
LFQSTPGVFDHGFRSTPRLCSVLGGGVACARAGNRAAARGHRPDFAMRPPSRLPPLPFLLLLALIPSPPAAAAAAGGTAVWEALRVASTRRRASPAAQEEAAAGVLGRLLPNHARSFRFEIDSKVGSQHSSTVDLLEWNWNVCCCPRVSRSI